MTGGCVSTTNTEVPQLAWLPAGSEAVQVTGELQVSAPLDCADGQLAGPAKLLGPQLALQLVLSLQVAVWVAGVDEPAHSTVRGAGQVTLGGKLSTTVKDRIALGLQPMSAPDLANRRQ